MEDLFKNAFTDYKVEPSKGLWRKIEMQLRMRDFFRFSFKTFNIYYLTGSAVLTSAFVLAFLNWNVVVDNHTPYYNPNVGFVKNETFENSITEISDRSANKVAVTSYNGDKSNTKLVDSFEKTERLQPVHAIVIKNLRRSMPGYHSLINLKVPELKAEISAYNGCAPLVVDFTAQQFSNAKYYWNFGDGSKSEGTNVSYIFENPGKFVVTLIVSFADGKSIAETDTIIVHPSPKLKYTDSNNQHVSIANPVQMNIESENSNEFIWWANNTPVSVLKTANLVFQEVGKYHISLVASNEFGCVDSQFIGTIQVTSPEFSIRFPSAFTPNLVSPAESKYNINQLNNDVFFPVYNGIDAYYFKVFTREGKLVYETTDPAYGWNGYYDDKLLPQGVYIWKATGKYIDGTSFNLAGNVTLLYND